MTLTMKSSDWREAAAAEYAERRAALVRAREKAFKTRLSLDRKISAKEAEIAELDRGAKVFGLSIPTDPQSMFGDDPAQYPVGMAPPVVQSTGAAQPKSGQFKDVTLELLAKAYPAPLKAADVQEAAEAALGRPFHWKTSGMTLYRLKTEGAVRRDGQWWFYVPPEDREAMREEERARIEAKQQDLSQDPGEQGDDDFEDIA